MLINCDMDSVLADLLTPWLDWINQWYGERLVPSDITGWDLARFVKNARAHEIYGYLNVCDFAALAPIPGAVEGITALFEAGHEITITTACQHGHRGKQKWLKKHLPWLDRRTHLFFGQAKYRISGDILIDDSPEQVLNWTATGRPAIVFDQPWNREVVRSESGPVVRARGWNGVIEAVSTIEAMEGVS